MITLSPRLKAAVSLANDAKRIVDVGCDHGYLSSYMVTCGGASFAYACDINKGPLAKARDTIEQFGIEDRVKTVLSDGLKEIDEKSVDTIFICGMGGELIADILGSAPWTVKGNHKLVLQPMTKIETLRSFLHENGYHITREQIVKEDFRFYCVMSVRGGAGDCGHNNMYFFSDSVIKDDIFYEYLSFLIARFKKIYAERTKAGLSAEYEEKAIKLLEDNNAR